MSLIKTIGINIIITLALLGGVFLVPPITYSAFQFFKQVIELKANDKRGNLTKANLALYDQFEWAAKHFEERSELSTTYYDYITWRQDDYDGETINIGDGLRHTVIPSNASTNADKYWFFGGSTTWGSGVSDSYTYPSMFAAQQNAEVVNFGETGYIARQSLAYMSNHLITNNIFDLSNVHVVFYDGVNDIVSRCRSEISGLASAREVQIQNSLKHSLKYSFERTFRQLSDFFVLVVEKLGGGTAQQLAEGQYVCSENNERAYQIAETLVNTWQIASNIVESHGGKFTAILQPVAFYGNAEYSYLKNSALPGLLYFTEHLNALSPQYEAMYPLVIEIAKRSDLHFIDLTNVYDDCADCYIDEYHVGPQAHQLLVDRLTNSLND